MSDIIELINQKISASCEDASVVKLAIEAVKLSKTGIPEISVSEHLEGVVRNLVKNMEK